MNSIIVRPPARVRTRYAILMLTMSASPTVCVVIPCCRAPLSAAEQASLQRCVTILGQHPLIIVKPLNLDLSGLLKMHPTLRTEDFADEHFKSVQSYNRLLLSDEFYARFGHYQFMLIYQLDAFVFRDELLAWCQRNYDYIGAPWITRPYAPTLLTRLRIAYRRYTYRLFDRKNRDGSGAHHAQHGYSVGNGGFSLRRIARMREILQKFHQRAERFRQLAHHTYNEDMFFCIEANRYRQNVKVPTWREALAFAWETQPALAQQLCHGKLPFGCHAWDKLHRDQWRPIFQQLGYSLDDLLDGKNIQPEKTANTI